MSLAIDSEQPMWPWLPFMQEFPIEYCRQHQILAVLAGSDGDPMALVASHDSWRAVDIVGRALKRPLPMRVMESDALRTKINEFFELHAAEKAARPHEPTLDALLLGQGDGLSRDDLLESDARGPVVQLVNSILLDAIQQGSSDIHLQPYEERMIVRMRIDGVLNDVRTIPKSMQDEVTSRLKVAGQMNIAEKRLPQDGRATVCVGDRVIDLRLASMPTSHGERVVVRLLDKSARLYRLPEIGLDPVSLERLRQAISVEHGLMLVTGPTGSGKSTTLYAALQELDTSQRNAVTLEDPIEYQLDGVSQTQINTKKGMTFASGLRSVLRQDPDIIMLGEIRDEETAVMAIQAALTGHLVFSTLHTNDASSAVTRLLDLGIESYLVASSLVAVLAQRLVRRRCQDCLKQPDSTDCRKCRGTGYRGREGIYELLIVDDEIRRLVQSRADATSIRNTAVAHGMQLLSESGRIKIEEGVTTVEEIERVTMRSSI